MFNFSLFHFKGQTDGEEVVAVMHRHWFNIIQHFIPLFFMSLFLIGSYAALPALFPILTKDLFNGFFLFAESLFAMLIWILFFLIYIDYYFDVWIITSKRVVNIEQRGLFSREISEVALDKIQDVTTDVRGVIPTFLNFGDVQIQTAAEQEKFLFRNIPDPYKTKDLLMQLNKQQKQSETAELRSIIHENNNEL